MGNHKKKFRLSDMIPVAWFYKLKQLSSSSGGTTKTRKQVIVTTTTTQTPQTPKLQKQQAPKSSTSTFSISSSSSSSYAPSLLLPTKPHDDVSQRKSYYFTRDLNTNPETSLRDPPRKSSKKRRSIKKRNSYKKSPPSSRFVTSSVSAGCSCRVWAKSDSPNNPYPSPSSSDNENVSLLPEIGSVGCPETFDNMVSSLSCPCRGKTDTFLDIEAAASPDLPPIITKSESRIMRISTEYEENSSIVKEDLVGIYRKEQRTTNSPVKTGVKLRTNSPRIQCKKVPNVRKNVSSTTPRKTTRMSESFAVVKTSKDPQRDFKESMVEMIMENDIKSSKELEELLACYLTLNSDEYHELIIKVFKQIWFDICGIKSLPNQVGFLD